MSTRKRKIKDPTSNLLPGPHVSRALEVVNGRIKRINVEKRLKLLQSDNFKETGHSEESISIIKEDEALPPFVINAQDGKKKKKTAKEKRRRKHLVINLNEALAKEKNVGFGQKTPPPRIYDFDYESETEFDSIKYPSYTSAQAKPKRLAKPKPLCMACGGLAAYTCTLCHKRFCSARCNKLHQDTWCLKRA
eukprot:GCRY01001651.1.p1 GENE.GCRY01001651.1~~GCRY01001651.1.p1  ORF type:complete len:192 (+),score=24.42 GCRY01001651.1:154-729(+)